MNWYVLVLKRARKQFFKIPKRDQERVESALDTFAVDPFTDNTIKIHGKEQYWRCRVGQYRVVFVADQTKHTLFVVDITRRTTTTYKKL